VDKFDDRFGRFDTIRLCDGKTDRHPDDGICCAGIASCCKKTAEQWINANNFLSTEVYKCVVHNCSRARQLLSSYC